MFVVILSVGCVVGEGSSHNEELVGQQKVKNKKSKSATRTHSRKAHCNPLATHHYLLSLQIPLPSRQIITVLDPLLLEFSLQESLSFGVYNVVNVQLFVLRDTWSIW